MPSLTRNTASLLRVVGNKQHATDADHHLDDNLPTPPASSMKSLAPTPPPRSLAINQELEDVTQDPLSSDDEAMQPAAATTNGLSRPSHLDLLSRRGGTTKAGAVRDDADDDDDAPIFAAHNSSQVSRSSGRTYSSYHKPVVEKRKTKVFQKPTADPKPSPKVPAVFQQARDDPVFWRMGSQRQKRQRLRLSQDISPSLSSLSSPPGILDVEDVAIIANPDPQGPPITRCEMCQEEVDSQLKQDYEDRYCRNGKWNIRQQRDFCRYHKCEGAKTLWQQRGYPDIAWSDLNRRMAGQHDRLRAILYRERDSSFRSQLAAKISARKERTTTEAFQADADTSSPSAGYYGPRGQKAMLEYVTTHLSNDLRTAAPDDPLIGSTGVGGGVSGLVQSILIPELALGLIMEDMNIDEFEARVMLEDSRELGEVLNAEETDRIPHTQAAEPDVVDLS